MATELKPLQSPDDHHLRAAQGWLELGNWREANEELERISPSTRAHPAVLTIRWHVYVAAKHWPLAVEMARALTTLMPEDEQAWTNYANSLYFAGRTAEARDVATSSLGRFPESGPLQYNLACYECQLGHLAESKACLGKAFEMDPKMRIAALEDPDLEPLWPNL
jgi:tetratricopeptide (TPR) repeat protein